MTAQFYYLNPDGTLRAVEHPGRCAAMLDLLAQHRALSVQIHPELDPKKSTGLKTRLATLAERMTTHGLVCQQCAAWFEECERHSHNQPAQPDLSGVSQKLPVRIA